MFVGQSSVAFVSNQSEFLFSKMAYEALCEMERLHKDKTSFRTVRIDLYEGLCGYQCWDFEWITFDKAESAFQSTRNSNLAKRAHWLLQADLPSDQFKLKHEVPTITAAIDDRDHLSALNDDCLNHIACFLQLDDFVQLKLASPRFNLLRGRNLKMKISKPEQIDYRVAIAGDFVTDLTIYLSEGSDWTEVAERFSAGNLKRLTINFSAFSEHLRRDSSVLSLIKLMRSLEYLDLKGTVNVSDATLQKVLSNCECLEEFRNLPLHYPTLWETGAYIAYIPRTIKRILIAFIDERSLTPFCESHSQLTSFRCKIFDGSSLSKLVKLAPKLTQLEIGFIFNADTRIYILSELKELTSLNVGFHSNSAPLTSIAETLPLMQKLDTFHLDYYNRSANWDILLPAIKNLKSLAFIGSYFLPENVPGLEHLRIDRYSFDYPKQNLLIHCVEKLTGLRVLELGTLCQFDLDDYFEIVKMCAKNERKLTILFHWRSGNGKSDLMQFLLKKNSFDSIVKLCRI